MGLNKDWTKEDNFGEMAKPKRRIRDLMRGIENCIVTALLYEQKKKVVGAAYERARSAMTSEELKAIQEAKDWNKVRPL